MTVGNQTKKNKSSVINQPNPDAPLKPLGKPVEGAEVKPLQSTALHASGDSSLKPRNLNQNGPRNNRNFNGPRRGGQNNGRYNNNRRFVPHLKLPDVTPVPDDMESLEYEVREDNFICFNGKDDYLSALFEVRMVIDGNNYNSVEHYYQACKLYTLVGKEFACEIKNATATDVKKMTKTLLADRVTLDQIKEWKRKESLSVLKHGFLKKFEQCTGLKEKLLGTDEKILVHSYVGENVFAANATKVQVGQWAVKNSGTKIKVPKDITKVDHVPIFAFGQNVVGFLLMQIRRELRENSLV